MSLFKLAVLTAASSLLFVGGAHAQVGETFADPSIANGLSQLDSATLRDARDCLSADGTSRAVRACTKTLRATAPIPEIRSELYARRGISQLSMGRHDKAADDFARSAKLDGDNMMAALGDGFTALLQRDADRAMARFSDCAEDEGVAALSAYGMGLAHEIRGDVDAARAAYRTALAQRPGWDLVAEQLASL